MDLSSMNLSGVSGFNEEYELLPPGDYHVRIVDDKVKTTKSGTQYLNLRYDIVDGKYARGFIPRTTQLLPTTETVVDLPDLTAVPQTDPDGAPLQGTIIARKTGHRINTAVCKSLLLSDLLY